MKRLAILIALLSLVAGAARAAPTHGSVGFGHGIAIPSGDDNPCYGTLDLNYDGSAENGFCWQYGGIVAPYYGAFAECYGGATDVCGIQLNVTGIGNPCNTATLYVWADAAGIPGDVLSVTTGANPCPVPTWPNVGAKDFAIGQVDVWGLRFWVGYWADNSSQGCGYFIAADTNGFGGCPYTNIAPGVGYPTGWQNASVVWGATQALGIGAWVDAGIGPPPPPDPTKETSWGRVKAAYR